MAGLKPIKLLSARERVIAALRKAILSGELPAGTIVTLDEIASQLEVSNTPVREAYQQLIYEGFLAQQRNRRVEVLNIGSKFIRDHFEARAIMEKSCAALACKRATEEDFKELDRRSIKMRYNSFRKGGKKYENNLPLIIELYSDCVLYNKSLEKNPIDVKGGEHLEPRQELDLSVFNKYLHVDADFQNGNTIEKTYTIEEMLDFSIASDVVA